MLLSIDFFSYYHALNCNQLMNIHCSIRHIFIDGYVNTPSVNNKHTLPYTYIPLLRIPKENKDMSPSLSASTVSENCLSLDCIMVQATNSSQSYISLLNVQLAPFSFHITDQYIQEVASIAQFIITSTGNIMNPLKSEKTTKRSLLNSNVDTINDNTSLIPHPEQVASRFYIHTLGLPSISFTLTLELSQYIDISLQNTPISIKGEKITDLYAYPNEFISAFMDRNLGDIV